MNIADKLRKVLEIKNNIKAALEEKGIENVGNDFSNYAESIANIKGGGDEPEPEIPSIPEPPVIEIPELPKYEDVVASIPEWKRPDDWIDLEAKIQKHSYDEYPYRVALLLENNNEESIILGTYNGSGFTKCKCITVDDGDRGIEYDFGESDPTTVTHEWDGYTGTNGYRWVIYHFDTPDITFTSFHKSIVQVIFDGVNANIYGKSIYYPTNASYISFNIGKLISIIGLNGAGIYSKNSNSYYNVLNYSKYLEHISGLVLGRETKFQNCSNLKYIPEDIDFSHVNSFRNMFSGCSSLVTIPELNTSNGTDFGYMFQDCSSLVTIPLIDTSNGTEFSRMFYGCTLLTSIPELNTSNGTKFKEMFMYCSSLTSIPLIDTSNGTDFSYMFYRCSSLLKAPDLDLSKVTSSSYVNEMFSRCTSLVAVPEVTTNVNILGSFSFCYNIKYIPYLKCLIDSENIFSNLSGFQYSLETIVGLELSDTFASALNFERFTNLKYIGCIKSTGCPQYRFNSGIEYIGELGTDSITNFSSMFSGCSSLTSIPLIDTSNGTDFSSMFSGCSSLTSIPLIDTSNGTNFNKMFYGCKGLTSIPELNTSNGTNFSYMFYNCSSLSSISLIDTSNGTDFSGMFSGCSSLSSIPELNTSNGTNFYNMFSECSSLSSIPLIDTFNGTSFNYMFNNCYSLVTIPELNTSNGTSFNSMFYKCSSLVNAPKLDFSSITSNSNSIFSFCNKLKYIPMLEAPKATTFTRIIDGDSYNYCTDNIEYIGGIKAPLATNIYLGSSSYNTGVIEKFFNVKYIGDIDISSFTGTFPIPGGEKLTGLSFVGTLKAQLDYPNYASYSTPNYRNNIKDLSIEALDCTQNFSYWKCLTKQSLLNILNALVEQPEGTTKTLTLNSSNHMRILSDEEKAIATNKGWTLSEYNA